jgi:hypothetical protein
MIKRNERCGETRYLTHDRILYTHYFTLQRVGEVALATDGRHDCHDGYGIIIGRILIMGLGYGFGIMDGKCFGILSVALFRGTLDIISLALVIRTSIAMS